MTIEFEIESPKTDAVYSGIVPVKGRVAVSHDESLVRVSIDDVLAATLEVNRQRPEVSGVPSADSLNAGFEGVLYSGSLHDGPHFVKFTLQSDEGNETELTSLKIYKRPRVNLLTPTERRAVNDFHKLYYGPAWPLVGETWHNTLWLGVNVWKCPMDLWIYEEIIYETRPDVIIETGTAYGGSALFLANICDLVGHGKIITVDIEQKKNRPRHARIGCVRTQGCLSFSTQTIARTMY